MIQHVQSSTALAIAGVIKHCMLQGFTAADDEGIGQLEAAKVGHAQVRTAGDPPVDQVCDRPGASCPKPGADWPA